MFAISWNSSATLWTHTHTQDTHTSKHTSGNECMVLMKREEERQLHNCSVRPRGNSYTWSLHVCVLYECVCVLCAHRLYNIWNSLNLVFGRMLMTSLHFPSPLSSLSPQVVRACFYRPVVQWGSELTVDTACMCRHIPWCTLPVQAFSSSASSFSLMPTVSLFTLWPHAQTQTYTQIYTFLKRKC